MHALRSAALVCIFLVTVASGIAAQRQPPATMNDLVDEVRALRAEIARAAAVSLRAQLLVARLGLQEQRINTLAGELVETRQLLQNRPSGQHSPKARIDQLERALRDPAVPADHRRDIEEMLPVVREEAAQAQREDQRLRTLEQDLANALAAEQNRWMDFNARLDEIERSILP